MSDVPQLPIAVSIGEPAGIGPDLILRMFADRQSLNLPPFIVYGHADFLKSRASRLGLSVEIAESVPLDAPAKFGNALPVVTLPGLVPDKPGEASPLSGKLVIDAIARATTDTLTGACRAIVTAPIHKHVLYNAGFCHPGHTEYLAALCAHNGVAPLPVMMLCHEDLRVVPVTIHVPISSVPELLTTELIVETGRVLGHDLRTRFGISSPRIAVAGLNPHAGEGGSIGREDLEIVGPAVGQLQFEGIDATGPTPSDTLFYPPHWRRYDAVLAMYHDQALIPIKTMAFHDAVNVTLGLPIVRTSPDHGTAFDLAGTGKGSMTSMVGALRLADRMTGTGHHTAK